MSRNVAVAFAIVVFTIPAIAEIIGGSETGGTAQTAGGVFVKLTPPLPNLFGPANAVGDDNFQSPNLFGFDEQQNVLLSDPLTTDVGSSPIAGGTIVSSHYIFFDPGPSERVTGTVDFDSNILGIMTGATNLAASDFLAVAGVTYLSGSSRGLEAGDSVTISGQKQILFDTFASTPGDYVRVITAGSSSSIVPEPTGAAWLTGGLTMMLL